VDADRPAALLRRLAPYPHRFRPAHRPRRRRPRPPAQLPHHIQQSVQPLRLLEHELPRRAPYVPDRALSRAASPARGDQGRLPAALPRLPRSLSRDAARARPAAARSDLLRSSAVAARRGPHRDPRPPRGRGGGIRPPASVLIPVAYADVEASRLGVVGEIVRRVRTPHVERILRVVVAALPVAIGGHEVDAGRIFAETAPWVADIVEIVGTEDVPSEAPSLREALAQHMHGAAADVVDGAHVPA